MYPARILFVSLSLLWLAGCSTTPEQKEPEVPAMHTLEEVANPDVNFVVDVYDPWGPMNRSIYNFNTQFDRYIFIPVVKGYEFIMPTIAQDGVSNFFSNISHFCFLGAVEGLLGTKTVQQSSKGRLEMS